MSQDRWEEVKSRVEGIGLKLKLHLEQEQSEVGEEVASSTSDATSDAKAALEEMGTKLQDAVDSLGHAAKDPAIRADVKDLGVLLRDVMNETLSTVGSEVGDLIKKTKGDMAAEGEALEDGSDGPADASGEGGEA